MTLKELLDRVSELCNEETKDLKVKVFLYEADFEVVEIWRYKLENDYIKEDVIRLG
jgi:hypothetical protein